MTNNVLTVPCACGCGKEVEIDGLGTAAYVSHKGNKLFCASLECESRLRRRIEGDEFLSTFNELVCSPEGDQHMQEMADIFDGKKPLYDVAKDMTPVDLPPLTGRDRPRRQP